MTKLFRNNPLLVILFFAFIARAFGIWYGLPSLYNSDEPFNVLNALAYGARKSLEPTYFVYPTLYSYLLFVLYGLYFLVGKIFGFFQGALDFGAAYFVNPTGLFVVGRFLSVAFGVASIGLIFKAGLRFFSKRVALIAAVLLTLSFSHVDISHWILLESTVVFMSALALYWILKILDEPSYRTTFIAGLVVGLAISTKYNAGFLLAPLLVSCALVYRKDISGLLKHIGLSLGACGLGFLLGSPYWLFSFSSFKESLQYTLSHVNTGMVGHMSSIPVIWPLWEIISSDWTIGLILISGFIYAFFQRNKKELLLLLFALPTLLFVGFWSRTGVHYLMPVYPALAILAAVFLNDLVDQNVKRSVKLALLVLIFVPAILKITTFDIRLARTDVRTTARNWIEANIRDGESIAYENYVYGPNLFDPGRFFRNPEESRLLPLALKERLLEERLRRISYQLINLRKDFKLRALADNPAPKNSDSYLRQLLETRLPRLSAVQKAGVKYLMVSSDNYDRYFRPPIPEKGTPAWLTYQNGRSFYRSVFDSDELALLREFKPGFWNPGPTIKIYKFRQEPREARKKG